MKKFPLLLLCFFIPTIINASPNTENTDVKENNENANTGKIAVQKVVNSEVNPELPHTKEETAFMPSINSRNKDGWGEKKHEPFTAKKFRLFEGSTKTPPDNNTKYFYNCPISANEKYCLPVKGELNKDVGVILRQSKSTTDANGFITDLQPPVLYDQEINSFEKFFYRFWNKTGCDNKSCWSPAYPVICNSNLNLTDFNNFKTLETGEEKARHYFGWREKLDNDINAYTDKDDYKIHVYMAPIIKNNFGRFVEDKNKGFFTALSPTGWKVNGNCLDPEFDYDLTSSDANNNTTTEMLTTDDTTPSLSKPKEITTGGQILPCGSFSNNNEYKNLTFKEIAVKNCENEYYSIHDYTYNTSNFDKYAIHLPLSAKFTNNNSLTLKENYDNENINNTKKMRTRICGTCKDIDIIKETCTEITRGVLYEKCDKSGDLFKCSKTQLEAVINRLKFDNPGNFTGMVSGNKISGYTNKKLECRICLHKLDTILEQLLTDS